MWPAGGGRWHAYTMSDEIVDTPGQCANCGGPLPRTSLPVTATAKGAQRHGEARPPPKSSLASVPTVGRRYLQNNRPVTGTAQSAQRHGSGRTPRDRGSLTGTHKCSIKTWRRAPRSGFDYCDTSGTGSKLPGEDPRGLARPRPAEQVADLLRTCAGQVDDEAGQALAPVGLVAPT